ncbi:MAG: hypothetical protein A2639_00395 [Candidatus Staskawiczbacteria bacterium RIFCSPHIGHO2_01_FULL_34_27]|uniref:Uncharacterized protein n=1 Tax=Candidatus Staskawiczbacteria bacterium RIFCSPHIGHO2_01_FULL_34_27 TaxID=1802199 RepID=A0A1G2HKN9_9BACT|nr:MAG: hypothetical protein A2639_00395 [Candidatus Staskawiczbacteria bacterium RIFCSPHIGHO2_01_FULL_34_27]
MNKNIFIITIVGVLLLSANFIYAEEIKRSLKPIQRIEELRTKAQENIKEKREAVKVKMRQIKDTTKQNATDRILNQMEKLNQVWASHFTNVLDRLEAVLEKIKSRKDKALANGKDVSLVIEAITKAEASIDAARVALEIQAQKTYVVDPGTISQETTTQEGQNNLISDFRTQFKALRELLFADLKSLRDGAMKDARDSVKDVIKILSEIPGVDD